jgi:hypothetical protein
MAATPPAAAPAAAGVQGGKTPSPEESPESEAGLFSPMVSSEKEVEPGDVRESLAGVPDFGVDVRRSGEDGGTIPDKGGWPWLP